MHGQILSTSSGEQCNDIVIDSQNRIVVVGHSSVLFSNTKLVVWRFIENGSLETTLGDDNPDAVGDMLQLGYTNVKTPGLASLFQSGNGVAIDSHNRIVVAGSSNNAVFFGYSDIIVWRFTQNGRLDTGFGLDNPDVINPAIKYGYTTRGGLLSATGYEAANNVAVDSADNVLIVGNANTGLFTLGSGYLMKLTAAGDLDTSFGDDDPNSSNTAVRLGFLTRKHPDYASGSSTFADLIVNKNNIVVAGYEQDGPTGSDLVVRRFTASGATDVSFGELVPGYESVYT